MKKLRILSVFLGNAFEYYDGALYSLLAPFLAPLFFPSQDIVTALMITYGMIPLGMLVRPVGAYIFGYIGDHHGRHRALYISMCGMAIVSLLIACLPDFKQIGYLAPALLLIGRMLLSFFAAGELSGGAIYIIENSEEKKQDLMSGLFGSSAIAGVILASSLVTLFAYCNIINEWWRVLYVIGGFTGLFGAIMRRGAKEEVVTKKESFRDQLKTFWSMRSVALTIAIANGFSYANYTMSLGVINGFVPLVSNVSKAEVMQLNTALLIIDFFTLPLFSLMSSKETRVKLMIASTILSVIIGVPLCSMLDGASMMMIAFIRLCIVLVGVWYASTFHSWTLSIVPEKHRYSVISISSSLGALLLGGPTAAISLWIYRETGIVSSIAWYWIGLGVVTGILMLRLEMAKKYKNANA